MKTLTPLLLMFLALPPGASGQSVAPKSGSKIQAAPTAKLADLSAETATVLVNLGHYQTETRTLVSDYLKENVSVVGAIPISGKGVGASAADQTPVKIKGPGTNAALENYVSGATGDNPGATASELRLEYNGSPVDWYLDDIAESEANGTFFAMKITFRACYTASITTKEAALDCIQRSYTDSKYRTFDLVLANNPEWRQKQMIRAWATAFNFEPLYAYGHSGNYFKSVTHPDFVGSGYFVQLQSLDDAFFQMAVKNNATNSLFSNERPNERRYVKTDPKINSAAPMFDASYYTNRKRLGFLLLK